MRLTSLRIKDLRVLQDVHLQLDADLIVFAGPNGSGKTSVLEAIHLLGTGRSFRARGIQDVIRRHQDRVLVQAETADGAGASSVVGVERSRSGAGRFRVAGKDVRSAAALARNLPLLLITPDSQRLLSDGAQGRRRLLDWLLFHVEPSYQATHARYRRVLKQRNAILRSGGGDAREQAAWCSEVALAAEPLHRLRAAGLETCLPAIADDVARLSQLRVELRYEPGWDTSTDLCGLLLRDRLRDGARGFTGTGPHRADLQVYVDGRPAQHVASRGEAKLLVVSVLLGFAGVLSRRAGVRPLLLVDELGSELDAANRARFAAALRDLGLQTYVTAVSEDLVDSTGWDHTRLFRVERGEVTSMVQ